MKTLQSWEHDLNVDPPHHYLPGVQKKVANRISQIYWKANRLKGGQRDEKQKTKQPTIKEKIKRTKKTKQAKKQTKQNKKAKKAKRIKRPKEPKRLKGQKSQKGQKGQKRPKGQKQQKLPKVVEISQTILPPNTSLNVLSTTFFGTPCIFFIIKSTLPF